MDNAKFSPVAILENGQVPLENLREAVGMGLSLNANAADESLRSIFLKIREEMLTTRFGICRAIERNRLFWRGAVDEDHGVRGADTSEWRGGAVASHTLGGFMSGNNSRRNSRVEHKPAMVRREIRNIVGILGKPPVMRAEAVDPGDDQGSSAASVAQRIMRAMLSVIDREKVALDICTAMARDGVVFARSHVETQPGAPAKWRVDLYSAYEVAVSYGKKCLGECPWIMLDEDVQFAEVMAKYPEARHPEVMRNAVAISSRWETRRRFMNPMTSQWARRSEVPISIMFAKPSWYWDLVSPAYMVDNPDLANMLSVAYPKGLAMTFINDKLIRVEPCDVESEWTAINPDHDETLEAPALCDPAVRYERLVTLAWNDIVRTLKNGVPLRFYNSATMDRDTLTKAVRGDRTDFLAVPGPPRDHVHEMAPSPMSEAAVMVLRAANDEVREVMGTTDPIMGLGTGQRQGYAESMANMMQAMQPHFPVWSQLRGGWARIVESGMRAVIESLAKSPEMAQAQVGYDENGMPVPPPPPTHFSVALAGDAMRAKPKPVRVTDRELADLESGAWKVAVSEQIPMSAGMRRAEIMNMLVTAPNVAQMVIGNSPRNMLKVQELLGLEDIEPPLKAKHDYTMAKIAALMAFSPLQVGMDPTGRPVLVPRISEQEQAMPRPEIEDTGFMVDVLRDWFMDDEAVRLENSPGWSNVYAYYMAQRAEFNAQQAAMMPPPPGAPPQGPPPPGPPQEPPPPPGPPPDDQQFPQPVM